MSFARPSRRHPDWPVVVAQTSLHEGYAPGQRHASALSASGRRHRPRVPTAWLVRSSISARCSRPFPAGMRRRFVPIDFTQPGDGFEPTDYGREALIDALIAAAPAAVAVALAELPQRAQRTAPRASPTRTSSGFALAAGASDAFPLAGAVAVPVVQAAMLRQLAKLYGVTLGQAGLCGVRRRARHRHAGARRLHLRRAPARQADPRLRADGRRGSRGSRQLRRHLRHGQGRQLFPGACASKGKRATRSRPSTGPRCGRPFTWRRSAIIGTGATGARP